MRLHNLRKYRRRVRSGARFLPIFGGMVTVRTTRTVFGNKVAGSRKLPGMQNFLALTDTALRGHLL